MADIAQLIGQLPPDANVFDFLANYVNGQVRELLSTAVHCSE